MTVAKEEKKGIWERMAEVDRRLIYGICFIMIAAPLIYPLNLPIGISPETKSLYDYMLKLPKGSLVMLGLDYGSILSENHPQARSVFTHCMKLGLKVILCGMWQQGATVSSNYVVDDTKTFAQQKGISEITNAMKTYGENYVNLGFVPGGSTGIMQLSQAGFYPILFPRDNYGNDLKDLPFNKFGKPLKDLQAKDIDIMITFAAGTPGVEVYQDYLWATGIVKGFAIGAVGVSVAGYYRLLNANIIVGILGSTRGAMEYDQLGGLTGAAGLSLATMDAQSLEHLWIVVLMVVGNIGTIALARRKRGET